MIDNNTGLMWQREDDNTLRDLGEATTYCENLVIDEYDDWRVPVIGELFGIVDFSRSDPAIDPIFTGTKSTCYWARDYSFPMHAEYGLIWAAYAAQQCGSTAYVRCVRGDSFDQLLEDNGDGTVTDHRSGLMWQKAAMGPYIWTEAIGACNSLVLGDGNLEDWRLPNIKESQSLPEPTLSTMINPDFFPDYNEARNIWTSTTLAHSPRYAFHLDLSTGETLYGMKIDEDYLHMHARCVRGDAISSPLADLTVDATGVGQGSVSSTPDGISYTKKSSPSTQTSTFVAGREITVAATAKYGATVSWSGTCAAAGGVEGGTDTEATCHFASLDESKAITADFTQTIPLPPVMTETDPHYYNTIAEAYASVSFDTIRIQAVTLTESLDLDKLALIFFKGGYDSLFTSNSGYTTIDGEATIGYGWIGLERIICDKLTIGGSDSVQVIVASVIIG